MDQRDEKIQQLSAENRRLVWKTERLDAEIVQLRRQVAALTETLADATQEVEFLEQLR